MWNRVEDKFPEDGVCVLAKIELSNFFKPAKNEEVVVVRLMRGITKDQREKMRNGEIDNYEHHHSLRSEYYSTYDEGGDNKRGYKWLQNGSFNSFCGQDITHWMEMPR